MLPATSPLMTSVPPKLQMITVPQAIRQLTMEGYALRILPALLSVSRQSSTRSAKRSVAFFSLVKDLITRMPGTVSVNTEVTAAERRQIRR